MSELKRHHINEVMDMHNLTRGEMGYSFVYYADEADKVIAELEMKLAIAQQVLRLNKPEALYSNLETMSRLTHEKYVIERRELHQKYKRCLAMARWCEAENYTECWYHENSERCEWTEKWHRRWLELAEKFKEAK